MEISERLSETFWQQSLKSVGLFHKPFIKFKSFTTRQYLEKYLILSLFTFLEWASFW